MNLGEFSFVKGVENDAIDDYTALSHVGKIWHTYSLTTMWNLKSNGQSFSEIQSRIFAYSALAIGVEKYAIEEDKAFGHVAKICHSRGAILDWLPCEIWSLTDNPFLRYNLWILVHPALSTGVEKDVNEEEDATGD